MGRQAIREMNRVGLAIDMSHSAERSTLEAIEISERPIAITHANPASFHPALRNKSDAVLAAVAESGGMLGFSAYPHHLAGRCRRGGGAGRSLARGDWSGGAPRSESGERLGRGPGTVAASGRLCRPLPSALES